jgi:putative SOS response-associated peptidase YedK
MCTRYTLTNLQALAEFCEDLGVALDPAKITPRYNVALTQRMPVIVSPDRPALAEMAFGISLPPRPPEKRGLLLANARAETFRQRPAFRDAVAHRRCLVPADGFYEWEKAGQARLPHYFFLKDHRPFFFAGLWRPEAEATPAAFVIVTTAPNELLRPVHDRMPVILGPDDARTWLGVTPLEPAELDRLCRPLPAPLMSGHRVAARVNNVRHESPDCVIPLPG